MFMRLDTIHKCDERTHTGRRLVPRLRRASRDKNASLFQITEYIALKHLQIMHPDVVQNCTNLACSEF